MSDLLLETLLGDPAPDPPTVVFGTVETASPLTVRVGADTSAVPAIGAHGLAAGNRVACIVARKKVIVIAAINAAPVRTNLTLSVPTTWETYTYIEAHGGRAFFEARFRTSSPLPIGTALTTIPVALRPSRFIAMHIWCGDGTSSTARVLTGSDSSGHPVGTIVVGDRDVPTGIVSISGSWAL